MATDICPYCMESEWTSRVPGLAEDGTPILIVRCRNRAHPDAPNWSYRDPDPKRTKVKAAVSGPGSTPLVHQLELYPKLIDVVSRFDRWVEYGIVEHEFALAHPETYHLIVERFGHRALEQNLQHTASAYLAAMLGNLTRTGDVEYRPSHGTGRWSYNADISAWKSLGAEASPDVLSWEEYAEARSIDPQSWPVLDGTHVAADVGATSDVADQAAVPESGPDAEGQRSEAVGLTRLLDEVLPLNRKERFYTATVLPALLSADGFAHFGRFLQLIGQPAAAVEDDPAHTNILFFTEYGFKESLLGPLEEKFDAPEGRDTPDVVIYLAPTERSKGVLIGVEAKMYGAVRTAALEGQLAVQRRLLGAMAETLGLPAIVHIALLPEGLVRQLGAPASPTVTVTWEQVHAAFDGHAPRYWSAMLGEALQRWTELRPGPSDWGANAEARVSGLAILERVGDPAFEFRYMGRRGGLQGKLLQSDFEADGAWRGRDYEVRVSPPPGTGQNWFAISDFVTRACAWKEQHAP